MNAGWDAARDRKAAPADGLTQISAPLLRILQSLGIPPDLPGQRGLWEIAEARDLVVAETGSDGREHRLVPEAAGAWKALKTAAAADGISLWIESAYRSIQRQVEIVRAKLDGGARIEDVLAVCAPPGFSEHHGGRCVDVSTSGSRALEVEFADTAAFRWLEARAANFGFQLSYPRNNPQGYQYEPWHWRHRR